MKKRLVSLVALLFLAIGISFSQDSVNVSKPSPVLYSVIVNNVPDEFNCQLIGIVNNVNGNHASIQIGVVNSTKGTFKGFQAGVFNSIGKDFYGLQCGTINSIGGNTCGVQNGFINSVGNEFWGVQSGFINTTDELKGIQDGFINSVAKNTKGMQNGFINSTGNEMKGLQVGFMNGAKSTVGAQIGFLNSTKKLTGIQFGFINSVDSIKSGIPVGFLSFVKKGGYSALEISYSDLYPLNIAYKTGIRQFYTYPIISYNPVLTDKIAIGFGIGTNLDISRSFFINPEIVSQQSLSTHLNQYNSLKIGFGFKVSENIELIAGPSLVWHLQSGSINYHSYNWRYDSYNYTVNDLRIGLNLAARFSL